MSDTPSKARQLLERLASTDHRRSLAADKIFRQLRQEERRAVEAVGTRTGPASKLGDLR